LRERIFTFVKADDAGGLMLAKEDNEAGREQNAPQAGLMWSSFGQEPSRARTFSFEKRVLRQTEPGDKSFSYAPAFYEAMAIGTKSIS
jgi:hypothetical protein